MCELPPTDEECGILIRCYVIINGESISAHAVYCPHCTFYTVIPEGDPQVVEIELEKGGWANKNRWQCPRHSMIDG